MSETNTLFPKIDKLIDGWCERRALRPLRFILRSYPLCGGLTDEWGALLESLKDIKGLCGSELTSEEKKVLVEVINAVDDTVYRRNQ
ncbi:MAG: hypothetical protein HY299_10450 [Verrucomicrobia bacterium]|nr:hypothetical protein [Verrucomicrobiota bacterium]